MQNLTNSEKTKIMSTLTPKFAQIYQFCFSFVLGVVIVALLNWFEIFGIKSIGLVITQTILAIPFLVVGVIYYDLVKAIYNSRYSFTRGIVSNYKLRTKRSNIFLIDTETYVKERFKIILGYGETFENIEGKPCLLIEFYKNKKYIILI